MKIKHGLLIAAVAASASFATIASAAAFQNGSFEDGTSAPAAGDFVNLGIGSTAITGWTVVNGQVSWDASPVFNLTAYDGLRYLDLTSTVDRPPYGGVTQTFDTIANQAYTVTFDLGSSDQYGLPDGLTVSAAGEDATFTSTVLGTDQWTPETFHFTATGSSTTLSFIGQSANPAYIGLDNVSVVEGPASAVPEPATWTMMLFGFGMVGYAMRRRARMRVAYA